MESIPEELTGLLGAEETIGTDSDRALLLDFQATLETKPEKSNETRKGCTCPDRNYHLLTLLALFPTLIYQSRWTLPHERSSRSCKGNTCEKVSHCLTRFNLLPY